MPRAATVPQSSAASRRWLSQRHDRAAAAEHVVGGELAGAVHQRARRQQPHGGAFARDARALLGHALGGLLADHRAATAAERSQIAPCVHITPFGMPVVPPV